VQYSKQLTVTLALKNNLLEYSGHKQFFLGLVFSNNSEAQSIKFLKLQGSVQHMRFSAECIQTNRDYFAFYVSSPAVIPLPVTSKDVDFYTPIRVFWSYRSWICSYHRAQACTI
jgi:hypothetical protein